MRYLGYFTLLLFLLLNPALPHQVSGSGILIPDNPGDNCLSQALQKATFSPAPFTYVFGGTCSLIHTRLASNVWVPWTGVGTYDPITGLTKEDIIVPTPKLSEPSRPYGRFLATMHCKADPWLDPNVKCDQIVASSSPPPNAFPNTAFGNYSSSVLNEVLYDIQRSQRPYTGTMSEKTRQDLLAQYQPYRKQQQLLQGMKKSEAMSFSASLPPSILSPTRGQIFSARSPVPVKLAPPSGWTVTGYTINIQRTDPNGNWVSHTSIPINAALAQSPTGYTGFGGGAPPAFLMLPGRWRLNAQVSTPRMSTVTDWIEFTAMSDTLRSKQLLSPSFKP